MESKPWHLVYSGLDAAREEIAQHIDLINAINLFPVPDADTGTNMRPTMEAAVPEGFADVHNPDAETVQAMVRGIRERVLGAATGNSGGILAQFFIGLTVSLEQQVGAHADEETAPQLTPEMLTEAFEAGAREAPDAVAEPVDGTVLTVISAVAEGLRDAPRDSWEAFLRGGYESGLDALNGTRNAAPGGREVDVVDAGGLGFMLIVRGLFSELAGRPFPFDFSAVNLPARIDHEELSNPIEVQATLRTDDGDSLREDLAALGDSLVLTSDGEQTRLHIHTADPAQVTKVAEGCGSLSNVETADMRDQLDSLERRLRAAKRAHGSTAETAGTEVIMQADGAGMTRLFEDMDGTVYRDSGELAMNADTDLVLLRIDGLGPAPEALPRECSAVLDVPTMAAALRALVPFSPSRDGEWNMDTMKQTETMIQTDTIHYDESAGFSIRLDGEERISDDADGLSRMLIDRHRTGKMARLTWYVGADAPHGIGRRLRRATREQGLEPTVFYGGQTRDALEFCLE